MNKFFNDNQMMKKLSKVLVLNCVRNTFLEDLHAGIVPSSKAGDYSDVKVVSPYGEIPWNRLSRLSDDEMKDLMKEIVNKVYTLLAGLSVEQDLPTGYLGYRVPDEWDEPELDDEHIRIWDKY